MKNILLPFLTFAMVMFVGCTESFVTLSEGDVTQPIVKSSLDDITFPANFTITSTGTSSFIIDPKSEKVTRQSFKYEFGDENKAENGNDYLTSVITESSSRNGYTIRITPNQEAVDLSDELIIPYTFWIEMADGRKTIYTIDIKLPGDNPSFDDHPSAVVFPMNFTQDSMVQTKVRVFPGPYEVGPENISVTRSAERMYTHYSTVRDTTDSTGCTYIITLQPTKRAEDYAVVFKTTANVEILYRDAVGARYSVESYPFDITFTADFTYSYLVPGVNDVIFPENFAATAKIRTFIYLVYGTDVDAPVQYLRVKGAENYILDSSVRPGTGCTIGYSAGMPAGYPRGGKYFCDFQTKLPAESYTEEVNIPIEYIYVLDTALYRTSGGTEGYTGQPARLIIPAYNNYVSPAFVTVPSMVTFNSDFTKERPLNVDGTEYLINFVYNEKQWYDITEDDVEFVIESKDGLYDDFIDSCVIVKTTEAVNATTGYANNTHSVAFVPSQKAVDYVENGYASGYDTFVGDTGLVWAYMRVYYEDTDADGVKDKYVTSNKIDFRFLPPTPAGLATAPNMAGIWIDEDEDDVIDLTAKFTWEQAQEVCANKERHPDVPWDWQMPLQVQMNNIFNAHKQSLFSGLFPLDDYWSSEEVNAVTGKASLNAVSKNRNKTELLRVRCVLEKFKYDAGAGVPDQPDFN